jgi:hypothetical protein
MNYTKAQIREMAKTYRKLYPNISINNAVSKAYEAYDIFRDAEFEVQVASE